jgi:hypothetical protein
VFLMVPPNFDPSPDFREPRSIAATSSSALDTARSDKVVYLSTIGAQATQDAGGDQQYTLSSFFLSARKLAMYEGGTRAPATVSAIADAVRWAELIMAEIDKRWK